MTENFASLSFKPGQYKEKRVTPGTYMLLQIFRRLSNLGEVMQKKVGQQIIYVCDPHAQGFIYTKYAEV